MDRRSLFKFLMGGVVALKSKALLPAKRPEILFDQSGIRMVGRPRQFLIYDNKIIGPNYH